MVSTVPGLMARALTARAISFPAGSSRREISVTVCSTAVWFSISVWTRTDPHRGPFVRYLRRGDIGAIPGHVDGVGGHQADIAVNPPGKHMFACARSQAGVPQIVDPYCDQVVAWARVGCQVDGKARVAAAMPAGLAAVDEHFGILKDAVEFQRDALALPFRTDVDVLPIPPVAYVEPGTQEVGQAEGMRQVNGLPGFVMEGRGGGIRRVAQLEHPAAVQLDDVARCGMRGAGLADDQCPAGQQARQGARRRVSRWGWPAAKQRGGRL
jgi:hypothetical protein